MKRALLFLISVFFFSLAGGQSNSTYQTLIAKASLFHLQANYKSALTLYEKAFQIEQPDALAAYRAAGMYSLAGNADKAVQYLQRALSSGWTEADWLSFDPYFNDLRINDAEKWKVIVEQAFTREQQFAKTLQSPSLRKEINLMTLDDQKLRYKRAQNNNDSLGEIISQQINHSDLKNLNRAKEIIKQYGWLKKSQIGKDGQNNLWLIVQHADQDVPFQQTALAAMEKLKGTEDVNMENYAFLYDRVQCNLNYKQLYGTQVVWTSNGGASAFRPIMKEYLADDRRKKIGLQPLKIYALTYGFTYRNLTPKESEQRDFLYIVHVKLLVDSAIFYYRNKEFRKTYQFYNTASTFLGGMSNGDNFQAAIIFSKIARLDKDEKYKSIALDFLELLYLRRKLTKAKLRNQPAFKTLYTEQRWLQIDQQVN